MGMSLRPLFLLWFELEVLIVFEGAPRASPGEAVAKEESVAEVACFDLVAELARTICIRTAIGWLHFAVKPKDNRRRIEFLKA